MAEKTVAKNMKKDDKLLKNGAKKCVKSKKVNFTKNSTLGEVIAKKPEAQTVLLGFGMHCFGCPITQFETIEEACVVHDVELELVLKKLNEL